jgi:hypothetical protein
MNWAECVVAPCGSHHLRGGKPAYPERFDEVLKFHGPGLAPVLLDGLAWHVDVNGKPAYASRFKRTFGFYEGLASVVAPEGAFHIHPDGAAAYAERHEWCGNFQGGYCAVRSGTGVYMHITRDGRAAYPERWRYAGDFRDGMAVVQSPEGLSTHINTGGSMIHGIWFDDLDVFHKGFARARDARGWMHIDVDGRPAYERRFASVEPFYNGQSRVETTGGGLEVIDEHGQTLRVLREPSRSEFAALSADMVGFWRTQTIAVAVQLGLFEVLPATTVALAQAVSVQPDRLLRLLRALGELNLVQEHSGEWRASDRGACLREDHPLSLAHAAFEFGHHFPTMWAELPAALRLGNSWHPPDIFGALGADPQRSVRHHQMLRSYARHDYPRVPAAMDLHGAEHVIDAGGGLGELADLLLASHAALSLTVLDRSEVIEHARKTRPLSDLIRWRACDFFDGWGVSADAVVLARVLHDWDDAHALRILKRARESLQSAGRLFIVEMLLPDDTPAGGLCDLHLLMATGGQERTLAQYADLLAQSGFCLDEVRRVTSLTTVLVGVAL